MFPEVLSNLQQEFKSLHIKLSLLYHKSMFRLTKFGVLPSTFIDLKDYVTLCTSYIFGTSRILQWRKKVNKSGSIRKDTGNEPGDAVSVYQLHSDHTGVVPQFSSKLKNAHIWSAQVMVYHVSGWTYVHLIRITIQEVILAVKAVFENGLPHLDLKFIDIMQTLEDLLNNCSA